MIHDDGPEGLAAAFCGALRGLPPTQKIVAFRVDEVRKSTSAIPGFFRQCLPGMRKGQIVDASSSAVRGTGPDKTR